MPPNSSRLMIRFWRIANEGGKPFFIAYELKHSDTCTIENK